MTMHFDDIPQFPQAHYEVNVHWPYIEKWLENQNEAAPSEPGMLELDPEYQRAHVWTPEQQIAYVEYCLKGGEGGRVLYWNHPSWMAGFKNGDKLELVDGKQRLEAVRAFLRDEIRAFGHLHSEFEGRLGLSGPDFRMRVARLKTRRQVLDWYLGINAGGTPHSQDELDRVRKLRDAEPEDDK